MGFRITRGKGFHITFENGITVSVQFGGGNYCEHYNDMIGMEREMQDHWQMINNPVQESRDAEVAIWGKDGRWLTPLYTGNGDDVIGWQSPKQVLDILTWASKLEVTNVK